ncbi:ImmA/IrrE family metallo-endopeptidase [Streptococcus canis]|nr:ImmA/IrrE family metallo-endopeptidase [Streptococcus canis]
MKLCQVSRVNYTYKDFFDYEVNKHHILVMPHQLQIDVAGFNIIDEIITIAYQADDPTERQNFTKCHELGHILLNHQGRVFTHFEDDSLQEREANFASAFILMPDIVLLTKIIYQHKYFQEVASDLQVSGQALKARLIDFLRFELELDLASSRQIVEDYITRKNDKLYDWFDKVKAFIISDYNEFEAPLLDKFGLLLSKQDFITELDLPELADEDALAQVKENFSTVKTWIVYNKGKTLYYAWSTQKLDEVEARDKANKLLIRKKLI